MKLTSILALTALVAVPATDVLAKPGNGRGHAYGHAKHKNERVVVVREVAVPRTVVVRRTRVTPVIVQRYDVQRYGANARYGAWSSLDRNRDGMLERWEWPHSSALFNSIDRNNDNLVSQWELRYSVR
jgi:hypothetical protein